MVIISNYRMTLQILSIRKYNNHSTYLYLLQHSLGIGWANSIKWICCTPDESQPSLAVILIWMCKFIIGVSVGNWIHKQFPAAHNTHTLGWIQLVVLKHSLSTPNAIRKGHMRVSLCNMIMWSTTLSCFVCQQELIPTVLFRHACLFTQW